MLFFFKGTRVQAGVIVEVLTIKNGQAVSGPLNPRFDIAHHSPTGYEWGYAGSGPHQLALAILSEYFYRKRISSIVRDVNFTKLYRQFCQDVISHLDRQQWILNEEQIQRWLEVQEEEGNYDPAITFG